MGPNDLQSRINKFLQLGFLNTLPIAEILSGKNARALLVCGFSMKLYKKTYPESMKRFVGAVWMLSAK